MRRMFFCFFLFLSGCADPVLHGIGVYEGSYSQEDGHSFGRHPDGNVAVEVLSTHRPLVIVLSSYEPVVWQLIPDEGVVIQEVIISSYHPSKVEGLDANVKVTHQSFGYSYRSDHVGSAFMRKVFEYSGINEFESYQGAYKGESFSIH